MKNQITIDDFKDYTIKTIIASRKTVRSTKYLEVIVHPIHNKLEYSVRVKGDITIYPIYSIEKAIEFFNET